MQLTRLTKKSIKGFTLIELLVVIAIIGLLSTIVAAPIQSARKKAKDTKKISELRQITSSLANYANDNGAYPAATQSAVTGPVPALAALAPQYVPSIPGSFSSSSTRDKYMYVSYHGIAPGGAANATTTFGYHLGATLEIYSQVLDSDDDCWGVVSTTTASVTGNKNGGGCAVFISADRNSLLNPSFFGSSTAAVVVGSGAAPAAVPFGLPVTPLASGSGVAGSSTINFSTLSYLAHPLWPVGGIADFQGRGTNENSTSSCVTVDACLFDTSDTY